MQQYKITGVRTYRGGKITVDTVYDGRVHHTHSVYSTLPEMSWMRELREKDLSHVEISQDAQSLYWPAADRRLLIDDVYRYRYAHVTRKWNLKKIRSFAPRDLITRTATRTSSVVWKDPVGWRNLDFHEDGTCRMMLIGSGTAYESLSSFFWTFADNVLTVREVFDKPRTAKPELAAACGLPAELSEIVHRYQFRRFDEKCVEFERAVDWPIRIDHIGWWFTWKRPKSWK